MKRRKFLQTTALASAAISIIPAQVWSSTGNTSSRDQLAEAAAGGFKSLFNGKNLDGWVGNKAAYRVENKQIVVYPDEGSGGNLFTEAEYSDFILRFQFQLTPGANNGLGIHADGE